MNEPHPEQHVEMAKESEPKPLIYVASLADYVNGSLHGEWIDATQAPEEIYEQVQRMLARSPLAKSGEAVEEWAIHDYDGFGRLRIGEYESFEAVSRHARAIAEHGPAYTAWHEWSGEDDPERFREDYLGTFDSIEAYARQCGDDFGWERMLDEEVSPSLRPYISIDYELLARDLDAGGDVYAIETPEGGMWLFHP
jgi:antirestriction protein